MFKGLDHVAILVADTEEALGFYRDRLGLPVHQPVALQGPQHACPT